MWYLLAVIHTCVYIYTVFVYLFVLFVSLFTCHPVVILCHDRPTREWKVHRSQSKGSEGLGVEFMVSFFQTFPTQKEVSSELLYGVFFLFSGGGWIFWSQDTRTNPVDLPVSSFWSRDCSMDFYKNDDENNWAAKEKYCVFRCLISRLQITFHILLVLFMSIWICKHIFIYTYIYVCSREIFWVLLVIPLMKQPT